MGGIDDGDGKLVGCGKRRIVSRIKWYPSLSVSSPCRSFSLLHPPSRRRVDPTRCYILSLSLSLDSVTLPVVNARDVAATIIYGALKRQPRGSAAIADVDQSIVSPVISISLIFFLINSVTLREYNNLELFLALHYGKKNSN